MMTLNPVLLLASAAAMFCCTGIAAAEDFQPKQKGDWLINLRATVISPDEDAPITTGAGAATGLSAEVDEGYMPSLGFSYFLTDNVAIEAIATATKHEIKAVGPGTDVAVHETWVLPPHVTAQYHFNPAGRVSPYIGAGVGYILFFSGEDKNGFTVDLEDGFSFDLEAGVDIALQGPYSLNVDLKKAFFETEATINSGALKSDVQLDPWVFSVGVGRKF